MKMTSAIFHSVNHRRSRSEDGSITLVFMILLAIMMILVTAEIRALSNLHHEIKTLEKQQVQRLNPSPKNATAAGPVLTEKP